METKKLTKEYLNEIFKYKDGSLYWKINRTSNTKAGDKAGYIRPDGYVVVGFLGAIYKEHRLIFMMHYGYFPKETDHINNDKSDNRIENLREVTHQQNSLNRKLRSDNTSKYTGVNWSKTNKSWIVRVTFNGVRKFLGYYHDLELANLVSIEARNKYHKEFVNHG
jgi:hypothetical protein